MALGRALQPNEFNLKVSPAKFLGMATLSQIGGSLTQQGVGVLSVFFATAYHLSLAQMGGFVSAVAVGGMFSRVFMGVMVDRIGPHRLLTACSLLMACAAAAEGFLHNLILLLSMLFILGVFLAAVPACGSKAVLVAWTGQVRGLAMGIRQTGVPVGAMLAAMLLPLAARRVGPHAVFWGLAVILLATGWGFARVIPVDMITSSRQDNRDPAVRPRIWITAVPAAAAFLLAWGQYDLLTYSIPFLHGQEGLSITTAGMILAVSQVGGGTGRILMGALSDRLGGQRTVVLLFVVISAGITGCLAAALPSSISLIVVGCLWFFMGMAMAGWNALMVTWAGERVPTQYAGFAMSAVGSAVGMGSALAPPLFGWVVQNNSFRAGWLMLSGVIFLAALLIWTHTPFWPGRRRPRAAQGMGEMD